MSYKRYWLAPTVVIIGCIASQESSSTAGRRAQGQGTANFAAPSVDQQAVLNAREQARISRASATPSPRKENGFAIRTFLDPS